MTEIKTTKADTSDGQLIADKISSAVDIFDQIDTGELAKYLDKEVTGAWAYIFLDENGKPVLMNGKEVHGLSAVGANETCRFLAHKTKGQMVIRAIKLESVIEEPDCFKASVLAGSYIVGFSSGQPIELLLNTSIGFARQSKTSQAGKKIIHAEVNAVTKAERNAKSHLLPDKITNEVIRIALLKKKVVKGDPDSGEEKQTNGEGNGFITDSEYADMFTLMKDNKIDANYLLNHCKKHYQYKSLKNIKKDKLSEILEWIKAGGKSE